MEWSLELAAEERLLGSWPRRLLHVPTMTSYEWKPGNIYGSFESPRYNAFTYTWGRWRLKSDELRNVKAIDIGGVPWDIPRIHPAHFNVHDFYDSLRRAMEPVSSLGSGSSTTKNTENHTRAPTEFVWLDVACIDQRGSEPRSAAEVGRQAEIFKGAQNVFIWLTGFEFLKLQHLLTTMTRLNPSGIMDKDVHILDQMYLGFKTLFGDPWFSSLWTLQEVFLRQDGILVSREGRKVFNEALRIDFAFDFIVDLYEVMQIPRMKLTRRLLPDSHTFFSDLADQVGLTAIATQNAMLALMASENRTTTYEEDRIYAIQQMFGLRLGNTSIRAAAGSKFTRLELEVQLGQELLKSYPIHSQAHVFTKPVQWGHGWMVNGDSHIPHSVISKGNPVDPHDPLYELGGVSEDGIALFQQLKAEELAPRCSLSVCEFENETLGSFKDSRLCPFATLVTQARKFEQNPRVSHYFLDPRPGLLLTYMDASNMFNACPVSLSSGFYDSYSRSRQRALADWLCCSYSNKDLVVLLLGPLESQDALSRFDMYGLLLLLNHGSTWKRVRFCQWQTAMMEIACEPLAGHAFFHGNTDEWTKCDGYFG